MDNIVKLLQGSSPQKQHIPDDGKPFTNESPMPFGKFAGTKLRDLPQDYLDWMCEQPEMKNKRLNNWLIQYKKSGKTMGAILAGDEPPEVDPDGVPF